jgi:hypothetical protein
MLFDDTQSLDSGVDVSINYQSGSVDGDIYWEQLTLGSFQIGYQAFSTSHLLTIANGSFRRYCHQSRPSEWKLYRCPWASL